MKTTYRKLFETKNGDIIIGQKPNIPILIWFTTLVLSRVPQLDSVKSELVSISTIALIIWSILEIARGVNLFRRLLGAGVLGFIIVGIIV